MTRLSPSVDIRFAYSKREECITLPDLVFESMLYVLSLNSDECMNAYVEYLMCQHVNSIYGIFLDLNFPFRSTKT